MRPQCLVPEVLPVGTASCLIGNYNNDRGEVWVFTGNLPICYSSCSRSHCVCSVSQDSNSGFGVK